MHQWSSYCGFEVKWTKNFPAQSFPAVKNQTLNLSPLPKVLFVFITIGVVSKFTLCCTAVQMPDSDVVMLSGLRTPGMNFQAFKHNVERHDIKIHFFCRNRHFMEKMNLK